MGQQLKVQLKEQQLKGQQMKGQQLMGQGQLMQLQQLRRQQLLLCLYCYDVFVGIQLHFQDTRTAVQLVKRLPKKIFVFKIFVFKLPICFLKYLFLNTQPRNNSLSSLKLGRHVGLNGNKLKQIIGTHGH